MNTGLLIETLLPQEGNVIMETVLLEGNKKKFCMKGIFMQADMKNRNGRNYPLSEVSTAVTNAAKVIQDHGGIFGELDHPQTLNINMDRVSHVIKEIYMDGANAIGKAELLDTPMGLIAQVMAESGTRYGISSRGTGDVDATTGMVKGFNFVTCDLVVTPSAPGAMLDPLHESLEQNSDGRHIISLAESVRDDPKAQKYLKEELLAFIAKITK